MTCEINPCLEPLRRERRDALYFASLPDGPEVNF